LHADGQIRAGYGAVIANAGLWLEEADSDINNAYNGGPSTFLNTGTFLKTNSAGTTTFEPGFCSTTAVWWTRKRHDCHPRRRDE